MLCRNPWMQGIHARPCGDCMPCRLNRRRIWTHRIMLESLQHSDNSFVTLTYSESNLPSDGSLNPKHLQDWLKRFRKAVSPRSIRYYAVGEYGETSWRPHYHLAIFGHPTCQHLNTRWIERERKCCAACNVVKETWHFGNSMVGSLTTESAQYVAGYVTKKLMYHSDPRLQGRWPEFCRMSLKPGIGAGAMDDVASAMMQFNLEDGSDDVPSSLRHGSRLLPLGRYLRRRLRERVGRDASAPDLPEKPEVRALREAAAKDKTNPSFKSHLVKAADQKVRQMEVRSRIYKQGRKL